MGQKVDYAAVIAGSFEPMEEAEDRCARRRQRRPEPHKDLKMEMDLTTETTRRDFIYIAAGGSAVLGLGYSTWPFIDSFNPASDTVAAGTTEVNVAELQPGTRLTVQWRGHPVFIERRTPETLALARADDDNPALIDPQLDADRVIDPELLVVVGVCTHLGCVPLGQSSGDNQGLYGGWYCPCHGSVYDVSGRVRRGPAPKNLEIPPYQFMSPSRIRIGD